MALLFSLAGTVSCESMLDDMGSEITLLRQEMMIILKGKPLPRISLTYETNVIQAGRLIDMGTRLVTETDPKSIQLTITNTGTIPVDLSGITLGGRYADRFAVRDQTGTADVIFPVNDIPAGGMFTVTVLFDTAEVGYRAALLSINVTDDTDEDYAPFNVTVACESTIEERARIEIGGLIGGAMTTLTSGDVYDIGQPYYTTITIWNRGTEDLVISSITLGEDIDFRLELPDPISPLEPNASINIRVYIGNTLPGTYDDSLLINYDEGDGPVTFTLALTGTMDEEPPADIELFIGTTSFPSPHTYTFHPRLPDIGRIEGDSATFQIYNPGYGELIIYSIEISGDAAYPNHNFTYDGPQMATVLPGEYTYFTVEYDPQTTADHTATITITSNDPDPEEETYVLNLAGSSILPIINITEGGEQVPQNDTIAYGEWGADGNDRHVSNDRTISIANDGTEDLNISGIALNGPDTDHFDLNTTGTAMTIPPSTSATFTVRFDPLDYTPDPAKDAYITITSNDLDTPAYIINLQGYARQSFMTVYVHLHHMGVAYSNDLSGGLELYWQYTVKDLQSSDRFILSQQTPYATMDYGDEILFSDSSAVHLFEQIPKSSGNGIEFHFPTVETDDWPNGDDYSINNFLTLTYNSGTNRLEYSTTHAFPVDGVMRPGNFYVNIPDNAGLPLTFYIRVSDYLYPNP